MYKVGIDIGSTTLKLAVTDEAGVIVYSKYKRHCAKAREVLIDTLQDLSETVGDVDMCAKITGTVGMGISEQYDIPFVQEVVAAARAVKELYPSAQSMIDIGGEDAKIVFFKDGEVKDLRAEAVALKELVADLTLENRLLKKSMTGAGGDQE